MKINVGCGRRIMDGWTNCDIVRHPEAERDPEILCNALDIPLPNESADVVMAIHLFEHFYRWDADKALKEWRRLLKPGGLLILELPNLVKCCQNYIKGVTRGKHPDQMSRWGIYGDPRAENVWMMHHWGYSPKELIQILKQSGFKTAVEKETEFHRGGRKERDMRIEAIK